MKAKILDPRGPRGKRTSRTIRRFLSVAGLLPRAAARSPGRHDPLREPARQLASLRDALSRDEQSPHGAPPADPVPYAAAARERQTEDPPRSPFGGGNRVALDDSDE